MNTRLGTCTSGEVQRKAAELPMGMPAVLLLFGGQTYAITAVRKVDKNGGPRLLIEVGNAWQPPAEQPPPAQPASPEPPPAQPASPEPPPAQPASPEPPPEPAPPESQA